MCSLLEQGVRLRSIPSPPPTQWSIFDNNSRCGRGSSLPPTHSFPRFSTCPFRLPRIRRIRFLYNRGLQPTAHGPVPAPSRFLYRLAKLIWIPNAKYKYIGEFRLRNDEFSPVQLIILSWPNSHPRCVLKCIVERTLGFSKILNANFKKHYYRSSNTISRTTEIVYVFHGSFFLLVDE